MPELGLGTRPLGSEFQRIHGGSGNLSGSGRLLDGLRADLRTHGVRTGRLAARPGCLSAGRFDSFTRWLTHRLGVLPCDALTGRFLRRLGALSRLSTLPYRFGHLASWLSALSYVFDALRFAHGRDTLALRFNGLARWLDALAGRLRSLPDGFGTLTGRLRTLPRRFDAFASRLDALRSRFALSRRFARRFCAGAN